MRASIKYPLLSTPGRFYTCKTAKDKVLSSSNHTQAIAQFLPSSSVANLMTTSHLTYFYLISSPNALYQYPTTGLSSTLRTDATRNIGMLPALAELPNNCFVTEFDGSIKIWNVSTQECDQLLCESNSSRVSSFLLLQEGRLASGQDDGTIKIWDLTTKKCILVLAGHKLPVTSLILLPNNCFASANNCTSIKIWNLNTINLETQECEHKLIDNGSGVECLVLLKDGRLAARTYRSAMTYSYIIKIWNLNTLQQEQEITGLDFWARNFVSLSHCQLACGFDDGKIKIWNLNTLQWEYELAGHNNPVTALALLPEDRLASAGSREKKIIIWNLRTKMQEHVFSQQNHGTNLLFKSLDDQLVNVSYHQINIWEYRNLIVRKKQTMQCSNVIPTSAQIVQASREVPPYLKAAATVSLSQRKALAEIAFLNFQDKINASWNIKNINVITDIVLHIQKNWSKLSLADDFIINAIKQVQRLQMEGLSEFSQCKNFIHTVHLMAQHRGFFQRHGTPSKKPTKHIEDFLNQIGYLQY